MYTGYDPKNYDPNAKRDFELLPVGDYRVRIAKAEYYTSKAGKESIKIEFDVSGTKSRLWLYIGCQPETMDQKIKLDQRLGEFFDAFAMQPEFRNLTVWNGHVGGVHVKHEDYNGEKSAKIAYVLRREKTDLLPPWTEPGQVPSRAFAGSDTTAFDATFNDSQPTSYRQQQNTSTGGDAPYIPF